LPQWRYCSSVFGRRPRKAAASLVVSNLSLMRLFSPASSAPLLAAAEAQAARHQRWPR
jgi:hypothetical protein